MARHSARAKHHPFATTMTRTGQRNMANRKPYRTAEQQAEARAGAVVKEGRHVSTAPVSFSKQKRKAA
ncbi:MAG TPA: hypothetical protein VG519_13185 [Pseudochrobactrum sp.]|nr:hypothetical protein [Pseudochrobactrum sp.]